MIFLLNGDIVSQPPYLYISNKAKNKSYFGLFLSLIIYISTLGYCISKIIHLIKKDNPTINYINNEQVEDLMFNHTDFYFKLNYYGDEEFKNNISFKIFLSNNGLNGTDIEIEKNEKGYYIINKRIININQQNKLYINLYCEKNCSFFTNNPNNTAILNIIYSSPLINHNNFSFPINQYFFNLLLTFSPMNRILIQKKMKYIKYITKGGFFFDKIEEKTFLGQNSNQISINQNMHNNLGSFQISPTSECDYYERIYPSILDILSSIGGFMSLMKTIMSFLIIFYSEVNNNCLIVENIFKKANDNIKNNIMISINEINEVGPLFKSYELEKNESLFKNKTENIHEKFKTLSNISFFGKICKKNQYINFVQNFVREYLSVENIIMSQLKYEEKNIKFIEQKFEESKGFDSIDSFEKT